MTVTAPVPLDTKPSAAVRRFGYVVASAVNAAMLYIANHLLEWGWPPWLTVEFDRVLPLIRTSLIVTMMINLAWIAYDAGWFKSLGNIVQSVISLFVTVRLLQVFPFDFSPYDFGWEGVTRALLVLVIVAISIAIVVEVVKLVNGRGARAGRAASIQT